MNQTVKRILRIIGAAIITLVFISVIPVGAPRIFRYEVYNIISGSMEPAIPVGSAIYVQKSFGDEIEVGDVAVFYSGDSVIAHRTIENDFQKKQIKTKGDANIAEDMYPVSYSQVIGKVRFFIPKLGFFTALYTTRSGKIFIFCFLLAGVIFEVLGSENKEEEKKEKSSKDKLLIAIRLLIIAIAIILIGLIIYIVNIMHAYKKEENTYIDASKNFTVEAEKEDKEVCPKQVDFEKLWEINPEIVAWIYCEDTVIDYPVCHADNDDYYLNHGYTREYAKCGAIFMEAENMGDFSDQNTILYGHHMKDKSMFATLAKWGLQSYYDEHPVMWLITPDTTYKILLFSEYTTSATSEAYSIYRNNADGLQDYVDKAVKQSNFEADMEKIVCDENSKFILLSTCAYSFENARTVLHGMMVECN